MATKPIFVASHYMQSTEWASLRTATGWEVLQLPLPDQLLIHAYRKKTPLGGLVYIPGFLPRNTKDIRAITEQISKDPKNITCKIEPCFPVDESAEEWFRKAGWKAARHVQYDHTVTLDLAKTENELWMGMKARGRQEINYARRDGVVIEEADCTPEDFETMHHLLQDTSSRKAFGIREKRGVLRFWQAFRDAGHLRLFFAKHDGKVIAGGIFITDGKETAWYKDAGSLPAYNKVFGPRLLLWEAALIFKKEGLKTFDLGGIPSPETYESSAMKGVYIFKTAFTRDITRMMPTYEMPLKPFKHTLWQQLEPRAVKANRLASTLKGKLKGTR